MIPGQKLGHPPGQARGKHLGIPPGFRHVYQCAPEQAQSELRTCYFEVFMIFKEMLMADAYSSAFLNYRHFEGISDGDRSAVLRQLLFGVC